MELFFLSLFSLKNSPQLSFKSRFLHVLPSIIFIVFPGEEKFVSSNYVIENMDRHKGGTYICTANNGVGQTASSQIALHVLCE